MATDSKTPILDRINDPYDLRKLSKDQLRPLAAELRQDVIDAVSVTGGHLGAGLGVVELTVALHYVFETPKAKIVWDVSHQCYPHKALTGRRERLQTLRQGGGLAGFTCRAESEYDCFGAAHSSTAISAALGFAVARDYDGDEHPVVAVVGDGAITGGMAYEALNNAGYLKRKLIVILNDNNMSIAPPAGALSDYLVDLRGRMPDKDTRYAAIERDGLPRFVSEPTIWDDLGLWYAGPFDGHDIDEMVKVLEKARDMPGPVLLHVATTKGKGYAPAEASADCYHGVAKFDVDTGKQHKPAPAAPSYTGVFAKSLIAHAEKDRRIVAVTAAMPSGTGLDKFGAAFPDRTYDVGIAEQHAVTFCGALACEGYKPFAAIYSTFLQRAYDQIVHDIAIQRLPVRFAMDRAGMVGADGVTHQGSYDIAYLSCLPGFVLMAAADEAELMHMVATAVEIDDRPSGLRYPRGEGTGVELPEIGTALEIGKGRIVREGTKIALLSYGARLTDALQAADKLEAMGHSTTVADARFAKPIDDELVARLARDHELLITIEEASTGGFATMVMHSLVENGPNAALAKFVPMTLPDYFIEHDKPALQVSKAGLCAEGIVARALSSLGQDERAAFEPLAAAGK